MRALLRVVPAILLLSACSSPRASDGSGGDLPENNADEDGGISSLYPAPRPPPPQVVNSGGVVLVAPRVVPVFFANDDASTKASVIDFLNSLGTTEYWSATTSEYGVGPLTATPAVELEETASTSLTDTDIQQWLADKLNSDDPAFPASDENTIYALHYPKGVTISLDGSRSCQSFGGYHSNLSLDSKHHRVSVAYAVLPRCSPYDRRSELDLLTGSESHELIEGATDPYPQTDPAYSMVDDANLAWLFLLGGGETGDMCAQNPESFTKYPPELPYMVQRSWSNVSALAGHDPCVPALPGVYFNAVPELNDDIPVEFDTQRVLKGVTIPVGESRTIDLDLYSDGDTGGPWDVQVVDAAEISGGRRTLSFELDQTSGQNGDKLHLTITADRASQYGISTFMVISTLGDTQNYWVGTVGN